MPKKLIVDTKIEEVPQEQFMRFYKFRLSSGGTTIMTLEGWNLNDILSFDNFWKVREHICEECGFSENGLREGFNSLSNFPKVNSSEYNHDGFIMRVIYTEYPMHPDVALCKILKEEIEKTVKIYVNEDNQYISLSMHKAVKNLVQIRNTY